MSDLPPETLDAVRRELQIVYADLATEIAKVSPICDLSGRCCRFAEYDHTLFLSQPEAELLLADAPAPSRPLDDGLTCPWQDAQNRCTARHARPFGCRVYFCDPSYQERSHELSEQFLPRIKEIAARHDLEWNYAPLHRHLESAGFGTPGTGEDLDASNGSVSSSST